MASANVRPDIPYACACRHDLMRLRCSGVTLSYDTLNACEAITVTWLVGVPSVSTARARSSVVAYSRPLAAVFAIFGLPTEKRIERLGVQIGATMLQYVISRIAFENVPHGLFGNHDNRTRRPHAILNSRTVADRRVRSRHQDNPFSEIS